MVYKLDGIKNKTKNVQISIAYWYEIYESLSQIHEWVIMVVQMGDQSNFSGEDLKCYKDMHILIALQLIDKIEMLHKYLFGQVDIRVII